MKTKRLTLFAALILVGINSGMSQSALFSSFSYKGNDARFDQAIDFSSQYLNPVVAGFYPDPSVCRKDDTYYLANSSFAFFPGVPLFESKDLVSWKQIGNVLDRDSQLQLGTTDVGRGGVYAPAIEYNEKNKTFYMITLNRGIGKVMYVKSQDLAQGWSDLYYPEIRGGDPSFFFDKDGKGYIVFISLPQGGPKYSGEMSVYVADFDVKGDSLCGNPVEIVRGGTDDVVNPVWIEGPHIYRIGKYYYLMCAQGGTQAGHTEVIFRSKSINGPYECCPNNPILAQQEVENEFPVSSTGHADMVQTKEGDWYAVFLGCRPYAGDFYNTGRDTFLLPVSWEDGWPTILPSGQPVKTVVEKKGLQTDVERPTGNFSYATDFSESALDQGWVYLRNPKRECFHLDGKGLMIDALPTDIYGTDQVSAVFRRQHHTNFQTTTEVNFSPKSENEFAGFTLLQNEKFNFLFGKTLVDGKPAVVLRRTEEGNTVNIATAFLNSDSMLQLNIVGEGGLYTFSYSEDGNEWLTLVKGADAKNLSTHIAGGFVGTMIGLFATSVF